MKVLTYTRDQTIWSRTTNTTFSESKVLIGSTLSFNSDSFPGEVVWQKLTYHEEDGKNDIRRFMFKAASDRVLFSIDEPSTVNVENDITSTDKLRFRVNLFYDAIGSVAGVTISYYDNNTWIVLLNRGQVTKMFDRQYITITIGDELSATYGSYWLQFGTTQYFFGVKKSTSGLKAYITNSPVPMALVASTYVGEFPSDLIAYSGVMFANSAAVTDLLKAVEQYATDEVDRAVAEMKTVMGSFFVSR